MRATKKFTSIYCFGRTIEQQKLQEIQGEKSRRVSYHDAKSDGEYNRKAKLRLFHVMHYAKVILRL